MKKLLSGCLVIGSLFYIIPVSAVTVNQPEKPINVPSRETYKPKVSKDKTVKKDNDKNITNNEQDSNKYGNTPIDIMPDVTKCKACSMTIFNADHAIPEK